MTDVSPITAAISDNQVPIGPVEGALAESVFLMHVVPPFHAAIYQDVFSYTSDGVIRPLALGGRRLLR